MTIAVWVLAVALFAALAVLCLALGALGQAEVAKVPAPVQWVACADLARYMVDFHGWSPALAEGIVRDRAAAEGMAFGAVAFADVSAVAVSVGDAERLIRLFAETAAETEAHIEAARQRALAAGMVAVQTLRPGESGRATVW